MTLSSLFPPAYAPWLQSRLPGGVRETLATCDSCAMVKPEGITRDPGPFQGDLKCCTYFPFIPSFGLGAILKNPSTESRLRYAAAAAKGLLLPLGLFATPEHATLIEEFGLEGFGQRRELLCPFFNTADSNCSIWENRPGVCTTYFCKSDRGAEGLHFWGELERYLNHFEWQLSTEVFSRLGFTEEQIEASKAVMTIEEPGYERDYFIREAWGPWFDRRDEFYLAAHTEALAISSSELGSLLDPEFLELERWLVEQRGGTASKFP